MSAPAPGPGARTRDAVLAELTAPGQPWALTEQVLGGRPQRVFLRAPRSLRELYDAARSDAEFYVYEDERRTFAQAWEQAAAIAHALRSHFDVGPGDRVAIAMRNYPEWPLAFMAATASGAVAVAVNALWNGEELAYALELTGAKVLIADRERLDRLAARPEGRPCPAIAVRCATPPDGVPLLGTLLPAEPVPMPGPGPGPDDDAILFFTSGSTGHPKGAVSTHRNVLHALLSWELDAECTRIVRALPLPEPEPQPATLLGVPLFHVTGSHAVLLASFRQQRRVVAMYKWDPAEGARRVEAERISGFVAPAAMTGDLIREAVRGDQDLSSLQMVGGGGAPRAPEQVARIAQVFGGAQPNTGWGMTETNGIGTGISGPDYLERPASSGRVSAVLELAVVDAGGRPLPAGARGELLVRGTSVFRGYWDRPDANAEAFTGDGWFRTGDIAYLDEAGFLFIVDRIKDLVIRGGENIGCGEVEAALLTHPDVLEASVYGVPDERLGEAVAATVYVGRAVSTETLEAHARSRLAAFQVPRHWRIVREALPRGATEKIDKRTLREAHRAALGTDGAEHGGAGSA